MELYSKTNIMEHTKETLDIKEKILKGLEEAYKKLIETKKKNRGTIIFSKNNKIIKIKP